jgi:peptide/nickel transport system substrate-binding protein
MRLRGLGFAAITVLSFILVLGACQGSAEPEIREVVKEVKVEVPVEVVKEVAVEKEVVKEVIKEVAVEKIVEKEVEAKLSPAMALEAARYGGDLRVVSQSSIKSLDCDFTSAYVCGSVHLHYQEGLLAYDNDFNPRPQLLEEWSVSGDGKAYTFTLRDGPTFHKLGRPITSDDSIANFERWMKRQAAGKSLSRVLADNGLEKVDDQVFRINLKQPYGALISHLGQLRSRNIQWPAEIAVLEPTEDVGVENYIGTGPFELENWEVGNRVILKRYEDYVPRSDPPSNFAGAQVPYVDRIIWLEIPSEETKIAGLKTGEWDIVDGASLDFFPEMNAHPDIDVALDKPGKASQLGINHSKWPTSERKFRQGIQYAMNTAEFMAALGPEELWTLCATAFHCGTPLESHEGDDRYNQNNLELAKQLIEESGYNGEPLIHMNPNDYGTITPLGPVFKKQMEAVGVNIELPGMDWATLISRIGDLDYWHFFSTWGGFYGIHDPITDGSVNGSSRTGFLNERMVELSVEYAAAMDPKEKAKIVSEIEDIWWDEVPSLLIGQFFLTTPYRKWVKNFTVIKGMQNYNNVWIEGRDE